MSGVPAARASPTRLPFVAAAALLVAFGLVLRLVPWGLPLPVHHHGGGILWGAMIYALVAAGRRPGWRHATCLLLALGIIVAVEGARLLHAPALDAFRATLAGQLLLGRIFSAANVLVDGLGAGTAAALTARWI